MTKLLILFVLVSLVLFALAYWLAGWKGLLAVVIALVALVAWFLWWFAQHMDFG